MFESLIGKWVCVSCFGYHYGKLVGVTDTHVILEQKFSTGTERPSFHKHNVRSVEVINNY